MKLTAERQLILTALATASAPIGRSHIPILACVLLSAADNTLTLTGTNMDIEAHGKCEAAVSVAGLCCASAAGLLAAVTAAPKGSLVTMELSDVNMHGEGMLTVSAGRFVAKFQTMGEAEFPRMTKPDAKSEILGWQDALAFCQSYAAVEDVRYYLMGVHVGAGFATATDGHRLGNVPCETGDANAIIPRNAIPMMLKAGGRLWVGANSWRLEAQDIAMAGKLVEGSFPDWHRVLPETDGALATVDADAMIVAAKAATLNDGREVVLTSHGDTLSLAGRGFRANGFTSGAADIPCDGVAGWTVCLNAKYLLELLATLSGRVLTFSGSNNAWLVTAEGFPGRAVILGMRF